MIFKICIYFEFQSTFMNDKNHHLETLQEIKQMMEKSSRFISLSGLSGIAAGVCALIGAFFAHDVIFSEQIVNSGDITYKPGPYEFRIEDYTGSALLRIGIYTFIAAFISSFIFTYIRSKKKNIPIWGTTAKRLLWNVAVPLVAGALYIFKLMQHHAYGLISPGCLIFYGLALINASKFTLPEIKYLGYCELAIGLTNLFFVGYGLQFWAIGFGILHIIYGSVMWWKYER
jgi:hypothetical protein